MIIGIGGASRSGKSRLAKEIKSQLIGKSVNIIDQDDFAKPENQIPKINSITDWEHPSSIDFKKLEDEILWSNSQFDYTIVEGFLIYYNQNIKNSIDIKIFLSIDEPIFLMRKVHDQRWGKTPVFYIDHIWKSYLKYGILKQKDVDLFLNANDEELPKIDISEVIRHHS